MTIVRHPPPDSWISRLIRSKPFVYATTSFGASLMHSVFQFYYVKVFIDHYHIPASWFTWMQAIYMVWNAINDPLLGYCQDHWRGTIVRSRRHTIYYAAPVWALTFLLPWFPWAPLESPGWLCGIHLLVALCAYDTLFTHVLLAHGSVLAEMTDTHEERVQLYWFSTVASLLGSSGVLLCETVSDHLSNFLAFQACCVYIAVVAWFSVSYTGRYAVTKYDLMTVRVSDTAEEQALSSDRSTDYTMIQLTWQILTQNNFFWFVLVNFLAEFHVNFVSSMSRIISEALVVSDVSDAVWNIYCGSIMILPKLALLLVFPILSRYGYYNMYKAAFVLIMVCSVVMLLVGAGHSWIFMAYTLINSILAGSVSLMGLPLSDIIDEDHSKYKRRHPVSSMVFGTNALVTKPAQSLAPMIAVHLLTVNGYHDYQTASISTENLAALRWSMLHLSCVLPLCVSVLQYMLLSRYTIRNSHLKVAKYIEA